MGDLRGYDKEYFPWTLERMVVILSLCLWAFDRAEAMGVIISWRRRANVEIPGKLYFKQSKSKPEAIDWHPFKRNGPSKAPSWEQVLSEGKGGKLQIAQDDRPVKRARTNTSGSSCSSETTQAPTTTMTTMPPATTLQDATAIAPSASDADPSLLALRDWDDDDITRIVELPEEVNSQPEEEATSTTSSSELHELTEEHIPAMVNLLVDFPFVDGVSNSDKQ